MGETQYPEKISRQPIITRTGDCTWRVSDWCDIWWSISAEMRL